MLPAQSGQERPGSNYLKFVKAIRFEVATRSGLSHTMVMRVEKKERLPTIDTLLRIAGALDVDLWKLLRDATKLGGRI